MKKKEAATTRMKKKEAATTSTLTTTSMTTTSSPHPSSMYMKRKRDKAHMKRQQVTSTPARENKLEEVWELCLSGRLLADFLKAKSLCELSTCARTCLGFRTQITKLHVRLRRGFLIAMASGRLVELAELRLRGWVHFPADEMPLVAQAFQGVKNLEVFHITQCNLETATTVLAEGLTLTARAKLKDLSMDVVAEYTDMHYPPVYFKGFTNLSSLCLQFSHFWQDRRLPLLEALYQGEFPVLKYLSLNTLNRLLPYIPTNRSEDELPRLVDSLRQGSLRQVKHFRVVSYLLDDSSIDHFLEVMPRLERLEIYGNHFSREGKKRLETAAQEHPNLQYEMLGFSVMGP
jgi:hypothetical protein